MPLVLEPWGEDYWLAPGDSVDVVAEKPDCERFELVRQSDALIVYVEGASLIVYVERGGEILACGSGRPA